MKIFVYIQVAWEVFSYKIPEMRDLLFLADERMNVSQTPKEKRPDTGTMVLNFTGCQGTLLLLLSTEILDTRTSALKVSC